jgi:Ca-activated chloride channel family protein
MSTQQTNIFTDFTQAVSDFTLEGLSFEGIVNNFHFIRPWWLLAFFALFLVLFLLKKIRYYQSPWQHFLPSHLANALLENSHNQSSQTAQSTKLSSPTRYWLKPSVIGCCIIFALAGPAWQKLPQPVYQLERGAVLIMDMSYSMYATDVKPNRLTRARYKAIDLLKKINEGDVGLIAYAGDAFIISPLTQDVKNIELLLPSLSPDIMPVPGANALVALMLADQTLKNSGHISGDIYWFTDDIDNEEISDVYDWANNNNHKVNILGVGSKTGAPIRLNSGELLKDNRGAIVIPKLPESRLSAIAQRGRGVYQTMTNDDSDIKALTAHLSVNLDDTVDSQASNESKSKQAMQGDQYQEQGPWLLLIILPLLLSYFRRGTSILAISWLMPLTLLFSFTTFSPNSYAAESNNSQNSTPSAAVTANTESIAEPTSEANVSSARQLWQNLWQTSDQQAQQHYQQQDYQQAAKQFDDSQWQGSAHYKAGDYEQALQAFKQGDNAQALYNQGNSLAQLQKVDEAIEAYKKALEKDPNLDDAKDNLAKLEELKKQQEQQEQQSQGDQENQDSEDQSKDDQQEQKENQGDQQSKDGQKQSGDQSKDDQQQSNSEDQEGEQEEKKSQEAKQKEQEQKEKAEQAAQAKESDEEQQGEEKSLAQQAIDSKAQETEQKHQQLLNKVTDDPYLLLRNKMRLEYQKRRNEGVSQGVTKKW